MTKPNRLSAVLNRPMHERPTTPAPAYAACRAAALRAQLAHECLTETRATLPTDPRSQRELARLRDALVAPRLPLFVEAEVDALFAEESACA